MNVWCLSALAFILTTHVSECVAVQTYCNTQADIIYSYPSALKAMVTKSHSYPPTSNPSEAFSSWPSSSQLALAECDFVSDMTQVFTGDVTAQTVHRRTSRCWVFVYYAFELCNIL